MLSHGLTTGALFLLSACSTTAGTRTRSSAFRGLWKVDAGARRPVRRRDCSRRSACPASPGSSASSSSLLGAFLTSRWYAVVATTGVILAAVYLLWAVQRAFTGEPDERERRRCATSRFRELVHGRAAARPVSLFLGFYPKPVLDRIQPAVERRGAQPRAQERLPRARAAGDRQGDPEGRAGRSATARPRSSDEAKPATSERRVSFAAVAPITPPSVDWLAIAPELALGGAAVLDRAGRGAGAPPTRGRRRSRYVDRRASASSPPAPCSFVAVAATCSDDGPIATMSGHGRGRRLRRVPRRSSCSSRPRSSLLVAVGYLQARAARRSRVPRADAVLGHRHDADGHGQRPHHRVPRARDPLDRALRARRVRPAPPHVAGSRPQVLRARLVLVGGLPLRHRARLRRHRHHVLTGIADVPRARHAVRTTGMLARSASRSCSSGSASRSRPRRSTCGRPTCTRARPRRSPRSWRRPPRPPRSPRSCASSSARSRSTASTGGRSCGCSPCSRSLVGSIAAIVQTDVKRMLAYSSIAHAGYVLIGGPGRARRKGRERRALLPARVRVHGRSARSRSSPCSRRRATTTTRSTTTAGSRRASRCSAALLTLFLLAQAGVPLTGGFVAKLDVFSAAVERGRVRARR